MSATSIFPNRALLMIGTACAALLAVPAMAQEAPQDASDAVEGIAEITVTAQRRATNLQETPISISALTGDALDQRGMADVAAIGAATPNLSTTSGGAGSGGTSNLQLYIRGIGQFDFLAASDPGVGVYIDGVYYARALGGVFDLLDIERVEILRGPQGTLFGKNALGGALQFITAKPNNDFSGTIEGTFGRFDRINLRGAVNLPIAEDKAAARVAFSSKTADAYGRRLDLVTGQSIGRSPGDQNSFTFRGSLDLKPSERVDILLSYDKTRERQESPPVVNAFIDTVNSAAPLWNALVGGPAGTPWDQRYLSPDPDTIYGTGLSDNRLDAWGTSAIVSVDLGAVEFKSITAYRKIFSLFGVDQDGSPLDYASTRNRDHQRQFSEEAQISGTGFDKRLKWVVGGFYFKERTNDFNQARLLTGLYPALEALPGPLDGSPLSAPTAPGGPGNPANLGLDLNLDLDTTYRTASYAAFGQATFDISSRLSLTLGARYTDETKKSELSVRRVQSNTFVIAPGSKVGQSYSDFSPRASVDYKVTDNLFTYFVYSEGFRAGGFDGRPTSEAEGLHSFKPEQLTSYELGFKSTLFDRRLRFNADVYYGDYKDIQLRTNTVSNGILVVATENAGKARIRGFEAELTAKPIPELELTGSVGHTDFDYRKLGSVPGLTFASKPLKTPKWQTYASGQYSLPTAFGSLIFFGDWSYKTRTFNDAVNTRILSQGSYSLFNARVTADFGAWSLAGFVTNLTDKRVITDGFTVEALGFYNTSYNRPREWGVTARYRF